jgi:hypothetical protein
MRLPNLTQSRKCTGKVHSDLYIFAPIIPSEFFQETYTLEGAIYRRDFLSDLVEQPDQRAHMEVAYKSLPRRSFLEIDTRDNWGDPLPVWELQMQFGILTKYLNIPQTLEHLAELPGASEAAKDLQAFARRARRSLNDLVPLFEKLRSKPFVKVTEGYRVDLDDAEPHELDVVWGEHAIDMLRPHAARLAEIASIRNGIEHYRDLCKPYEQTFNGVRIPSCKPVFLDPERREGTILRAYHPAYLKYERKRIKRREQFLIKAMSVPNDIHWGDDARMTFLQGPNSMGKSVYLDVVGLNAHLPMAGLRCFAEYAELSPVGRIFPCLEMGANMEDGHFATGAKKVRYMLDRVKENDIVLLDEVAGGTEPDAERDIARGISEALMEFGITTFNSTHDRNVWRRHKRDAGVAFMRVADIDDKKRKYQVWPGIAKGGYGMKKARELGIDPTSAKERLARNLSK